MANPRAQGRAKHASKLSHRPSRNPFFRILLACVVALGIAIPAAAIAQSGQGSHQASRHKISGGSWWNEGQWLRNWHKRFGHPHWGGGSGVVKPPTIPTITLPSTHQPPSTSTPPTTSKPPTTSTPPSTTTPPPTTSTPPPTTTPPNPGSGQIVLGADGNAEELQSRIDHPLARHYYRDFSQEPPADASMLTVGSGLPWRQVANMQPGSKIYQDVVRWAHTLRDRGGSPLLAYSHEPEQSSRSGLGGPEDFKAAFQKVVSVMRANGATNVRYTWQMTGWSFRAKPSSPMAAQKWYPGDAYVDVVGPDEYNWFTCGEGLGKWLQLRELAAPAMDFARAHGKKFAIPEFASYVDGRRTDWIKQAHDFLESNRGLVVAVFYFQYHPTNKANSDCVWSLQKDSEYDAFETMVRDSSFRHR